MKPIGLYLHIPFCSGKCPYCDFYSVTPKENIIDNYVSALCRELDKTDRIFDTVYFGGGTPSQLGADNIVKIMSHIQRTPGCEATLECNPSDTGRPDSVFDFEKLAECGINRISMGLQSANDSERAALGRRSGCKEVEASIERIRNAGINNISLDLMLGLPNQTEESLRRSIEFCKSSGAKHISAYILKIEEGTPFFAKKNLLSLPDENKVCDFYLETVSLLAEYGYNQYEISNFSLPCYESKLNLKYWRCEVYLGLGASAHSFINGRRFYYERSIDSFINGDAPTADGEGGDEEEYIMLALRLSEGLVFEEFEKRFGHSVPESLIEKAKEIEKHGLLTVSGEAISLTANGFLLSNSVITTLL
ncbi:MAG: radical SAM family heme chaperone HemW [Clostridia bacterium]|nr:radical SAM family heme chaperone HemW [Clostridia bacterium]